MFCGDAEAGEGAAEPLALADALAVLLPGAPRGAHRLWRLHAELGGGASPLLPTGWEQRCDKATGRIFYIDHNERTTSWVDPRLKPSARAAVPAEAPPLLSFGLAEWDSEAAPGGEQGGAAAEGEAAATPSGSPAGSASPGGEASSHGASLAELPVPVDGSDVVLGAGEGVLGGREELLGGALLGGSNGLLGGSADGQSGAGDDPLDGGSLGGNETLQGTGEALLRVSDVLLSAPAGGASSPPDADTQPRGTSGAAPPPPVELQALSCGALPSTPDRLARRAHLQLTAATAAAAAAASIPSAHGRRGYDLLLHRRCRLIQRLHLALRRQNEMGEVSIPEWEALFIEQRKVAAAGRPVHSAKVAERAVEAIDRHASARLTDAYTTQWLLKTRTHLARCSVALASLYPLQILDAPPAQVSMPPSCYAWPHPSSLPAHTPTH
jgi:hypothetical protein